jgi:aspartate kinase
MSTRPSDHSLAGLHSDERTALDGRDGRTVVWKFGGTSVGDPERVRAVAERMVRAQRDGLRVVAVLSAMGHTTDELVNRAHQLSGRPPLREMDALLSVGESISVALTAMAVHELGSRAVSLTGGQAGMVTDGAHGNARLRSVRPERVRSALDDGAIVLVTGFQGVSETGDVTTMGRGGSDASAVAVAAGLGLGEVDIHTDVDGVYTADPRIVPDARRLTELRHEEMLELAEAGAGVLQPRAVELAAAHDVDIHLRSSFSTEPGTWVRRRPGPDLHSDFEHSEVIGVAHRRSDPLFSVRGVPSSRVLAALAGRGASLELARIAADELDFSAPGAEVDEIDALLASLGGGGGTRTDLGTVSLVSPGIARSPRLVAGVLAELDRAGLPARFVATTPSRVSVHLDSGCVDDAVRLLHRRFVPAAVATPPRSTVRATIQNPMLAELPVPVAEPAAQIG